jgi:hypothetical protein
LIAVVVALAGCTLNGQLLEPEEAAAKLIEQHFSRGEVEISGSSNTPYRCIGEAISILQRAGLS